LAPLLHAALLPAFQSISVCPLLRYQGGQLVSISITLMLLLFISVRIVLVCPCTSGGPCWCSSNGLLVLLLIIVPSQVWAQIFAEGFCRCPHARHDS
jgi:hypothetical protein